EQARSVAATIRSRANDPNDPVADDVAVASGPDAGPGEVDEVDATTGFAALLERQADVATGDQVIREADIARLDALPALARTAAQGRNRAITSGGLAVLVALAGTLLVVGGSRHED